MASFASYSLAKRHADGLVKDLAKGSQVTALHPAQARDALAALERLETLRQSSGRRFSLLAAVSEFAEAVDKLRGRTLGVHARGIRHDPRGTIFQRGETEQAAFISEPHTFN